MIYPTFQQEALNLTTDYSAFKGVLEVASRFEDTDLYLTSGYVNFPAEIADVLSTYRSKMHYLFAAPQANSFFHDPGFASVIPALYNIVDLCGAMHCSCRVTSSSSAERRRRTLPCTPPCFHSP